MKKQIINILVLSVGILLILVGIIFVFLPIIPGLILVIPGVYLVSLKSIWVKNKLEKFLGKHPFFRKIFKK